MTTYSTTKYKKIYFLLTTVNINVTITLHGTPQLYLRPLYCEILCLFLTKIPRHFQRQGSRTFYGRPYLTRKF